MNRSGCHDRDMAGVSAYMPRVDDAQITGLHDIRSWVLTGRLQASSIAIGLATR